MQKIGKPLLALPLCLASVLLLADGLPGSFGAIDLVQYWSSSVAALRGNNPYDAAVLWELQKGELSELTRPVMMWNPPQLLPLLVWSALFSFNHFVTIWFAFSCTAFGICALACLQRAKLENGPDESDSALPFLVVLTFFPIALSVSYGQIGAVLLLGWFGCLFFSKASWDRFIGGVCLAITAVKPHLLYLIYLWTFLCFLRYGRNRLLLGFFSGIALLSIATFAINPALIPWYIHAAGSPPIYFKTPTAGSWLQESIGKHEVWIRCFPTITGAVVVAAFFLYSTLAANRALRPSTLLALVPWSLVTSPYGWVYDQVLILPTALWLACAAGGRFVPILIIMANVTTAITPSWWGQHWGVWYPIVLGLLAIQQIRREQSSVDPTPNISHLSQ